MEWFFGVLFVRPHLLKGDEYLDIHHQNIYEQGKSQIGKEVHQGCILSPCLFKLYAEYIMRNAGLIETQLKSRLLGEISITSDMHMIPLLRQKAKKN